MEKDILLRTIGCPLASQLVINAKLGTWEGERYLGKAFKKETGLRYAAINGFDWERSPQNLHYWCKFDEGEMPDLLDWS